jgi:hypothetical protein
LEIADSERRFLALQNRFRGLVGELRTKRFVKDRKLDPIQRFRSDLSKLYLDMRADLTLDQYPEMIAWVSDQVSGQLKDVLQAPLRYDDLSGVYPNAPVVSLERELTWIAHRLSMSWSSLRPFIDSLTPISIATLQGRYEEALEVVALLQEKLGVSLWSVQLRLALKQQAGGLERQKRYAAEVRKIYRHGLLGFTTYHTSVRNEDRTTLPKYLDDLEYRILKHPYYDDALKHYARFRLKGEIGTTSAEIADILRIEQSHSIQDIYQTFIAVIQELIRRGPDLEQRKMLLRVVSILPKDDFRLLKIEHYLDPSLSIPHSRIRATDVPDNLLIGEVQRANLLSIERCRYSVDPWDIIYAGLGRAALKPTVSDFSVRPTTIAKALGAIFGRGICAADAAAQLSKLTQNFSGLPFAAGLAAFEGLWRRLRPDSEWMPFKVGLNSPMFGIEDWQSEQPLAKEFSDHQSPAVSWWKTSLGYDDGTKLVGHCGALAVSIKGLVSGNMDCSIQATKDAHCWPEPLRSLGILVRLHALFARGDRTSVISLLAREGARGSAYSHFLPIRASLEGLEWADYKEVENPIAASIAIHLLWLLDDESKIASLLRFAASQSLRKPEKRRPSTFEEQPTLYSHDELVYFLRHVCAPNILDQARVVTGTRAMMEERQAICSFLLELDPLNTSAYNEEITTIAEQLAIDEGQWIVDSTRIYVDTEALTRWAQRELTEDFGRYLDLVSVEVGHAQSFDDVLRELLETNPASKSAYVPETEAEAVLVSMLRRLGQEFLSNPMFGLDFNLSKRVRHQSFVGLIRGPLETAQLITTRESEAGEYHSNTYWLGKFARGRDEIDDALRKFAANFDDTLAAAKDTALHLRSPEKPEGLFVLNLSAHHIAIARGIIRLNPVFSEFVSSAIVLLWVAIDQSLQQVRELISVQLKAKLIDGFGELRAAVRRVAEGDLAFWEFDAAVGQGSAEVQARLDEAANWFQRADRIRAETTFTLDQVVKIAADTALKSQRNYSPKLNYEVEGDIVLYAGNLIFVHDVLFVALGNAQKHSGFNTPTIDVHVRHDPLASTLEIEAICDSRQSNRRASEERVRAIRSLIDSGSIASHTRKEGRSGFVKLAAVLGQSQKGKIEFGYTEEGRFRLAVTYAVANLPERTTDVS